MLKNSTIGLLKQLGVAALYALLFYIGEGHFESGAIVGYFEPASGLALAAMLLGGKRYAWGVLLGAFLIHAISDNSLWEIVIVASGDTLQALCGAWLLTRESKFDLRLQSLRDYLRLILLGGGASIAIGALVVNTALLISGLPIPGNYFHSLIQWWMSDTLGVILFAPLILVWCGTRNDWREAGRMAEAVLLLGLTILVGQAVFLGWWHDVIGQVAKGYWLFLITAWVAVRHGTRETVIVLVMTAIYALLGAIHGIGFFADDIAQTHLVNYWLFMVTLSIVGMALATHFTERKQLEQQLSRRLRHRDVMERITQVSLNSASIEELLGRVLDEILTAFNADRAYFLYPCDPDAPSWSVPMERTRPEWPGAFAHGMVIPMTPEAVEVFRDLLASIKPLPYGPASRGLPAAVAEQFSIRSMIQMVLRPRVGGAWVIGLHHCAQARAYDEDDLLIFKEIGGRVADALSSMIILKNLRESEQRFRQLAENTHETFWLGTPDWKDVLYISPAYEKIWGRSCESLYAKPLDWLNAVVDADREKVIDAISRKSAGDLSNVMFPEYRILRPDGSERWIQARAFPVRDAEGKVYRIAGIAEDITERKQAEEQIYQLAFYDLLTGLPNRSLLNDRLGQTLATSKRSGRYGALMFIDLDNFKPLNDTYGHGVGDLLLIEVARRITSCVREVDTVARFGGDEFVVILSELDVDKTESLAQANIVAEKIHAILAEPYVLTIQQEGKAETTVEYHCSASIGVVVFSSETGQDDIIKWADIAMYQAKDDGRNLIRFFAAQH